MDAILINGALPGKCKFNSGSLKLTCDQLSLQEMFLAKIENQNLPDNLKKSIKIIRNKRR